MKRAAGLIILVLLVGLADGPRAAQVPPFGGADALRSDLAARRAAVMDALGAETMLIAWSAPARVYSTDVDYEYRQESNLLYLTNLTQEDLVLVLVPGSTNRRVFLFAPEPNPLREHWFGRNPRPAEITAASGIEAVFGRSDFGRFLDGLLQGTGFEQPAGLSGRDEFGAWFAALGEGRARLAVLDSTLAEGTVPEQSAADPVAIVRGIQQAQPALSVADVTPVLNRLRQVKSPYEQAVLRESARISAEAHVEGMKVTRPGRWEYEVEAAIEYGFHRNGAMSWAYPSIVASGPNATTLHYGSSDRQMQAGELLLVDAGANFQGMAADITRTYPVSGRFTPEQRAIYDLVLTALRAGMAAAVPGQPAAAIVRATRASLSAGLLELGLITDESQVGLWFTHSPIHGIGLDVHDPFDPQRPLEPGMAFVIEPGLYFRAEALDQLGQTGRGGGDPAARAEALARIRPVFERYRDIGIRIENSFLMTSDGLENLSAVAPVDPPALEAVVGTAP